MAYVAVSKSYQHVPYVVLVFVVEKLVYTVAWIVWITRFGDQLSGLLSDAPMTGVFYMTYGLVDFSFGVFFAWVALTTLRGRSSIKANP